MEKTNQRKSEFDKLVEDLTGKHSKRMNAILLVQGDEHGSENDFANNYFKLLEYVKPKLQRSEIIEEDKEHKIIIEHVTVNDEVKSN